MPADIRAVPGPNPVGGLPLDPTAALAGRHLLVTGVTGFVGKVWLSQLLYELPEIGRVDVLIRDRREATAVERFARIAARSPAFRPLRERHGAGLGAFLCDRVRVLPGDVREPDAGLSAEVLADLAPSLDAIVHFAGLTDFDPDPARAFAVNVRGTANLAALAEQTDHAALLHCSTCFVAGVADGLVAEELTCGLAPSQGSFDVAREIGALAQLLAEESDPKRRLDLTRERARALGWPNVYTYTKGLAEHLLAASPIETTIIRPSIVECAIHYPFSGWNEGLNTTGPLLWLLRSPFRHFPAQATHHFDVVPVDAVTRTTTLALAALLRGEAAPVYQVSSSRSNPMTMGRGIELANLAIRRDLGRPDATRFQRLVVRHLDTVPVDADKDHLFALPRLRGLAQGLGRALEGLRLDALLPKALYGAFGPRLEDRRAWAAYALDQAGEGLGRLQRMLDLYRPFIHDHDWVFDNERARGLTLRLSPEDRSRWGWIVDDIDWRAYWLDVLYPGLATWSLPILEGRPVPEDPEGFAVDLGAVAPSLTRVVEVG